MKVNYKSIVLPIVSAGVLLYEALTHHSVPKDIEATIVNDIATGVSFAVTIWGIYKNHKKVGDKK